MIIIDWVSSLKIIMKIYKNLVDYSKQNECHRNTASKRVKKWLENWTIIKIEKGTKYIEL